MGVILLAVVAFCAAAVYYVINLVLRVILRAFMNADSAAETAKWLLGVAAIVGGIALIACIIGAIEGAGQAWGYVAFVVGGAAVVAFFEWLANR